MRTRDWGPSGRPGQRPRPGAGKRPYPADPASSRRSLSRPGMARCPIFPENTPPFWPGQHPPKGNPSSVRSALPGAGHRGCRCEAGTAVTPASVNPPSHCCQLPALGRGRPARSSTRPAAAAAHPVQSGRSLHPAPRPAPYPASPRRGMTGGRQQQRQRRRRLRGAPRGWSAAEPRGAAPTMAELRRRAPRPQRPSGSG